MLKNYLKAGYPALCILTQEPDRALRVLPCEGWRFMVWDCIDGIRESGKVIEEATDPVQALNHLNQAQDTVLIAQNLHLFLEAPELIQTIQNGVQRWKSTGCCLVILSPMLKIVPEIEKLITVIDLSLPGDEALFVLQQEIGKPLNVRPNRKAALAAQGLTEFEAETAYALSLVRRGFFSTRVVTEAKAQMIRKSGLMEFWEPARISDVGGLGNLKRYIRSRVKAFSSDQAHLPKPKGILLVGIPGTGKSLACKATASILNWPLIRLDIGALKNSLVGESERRIREATKVIDAFGNAVIWLDEAEKALSGSRSSGETDAGTTSGMLSHILTWMSETRTPILIMATANDITKLPPEFMRAGRFDAIFSVDSPTSPERREIIDIMNQKYGARIPPEYADKLSGYTGAEIEQLARDSLFDGLENAFNGIIPLARTMREEIQALRDWAKNRARVANTPEDEPPAQRRIRKPILNIVTNEPPTQ